MVPDAGETSRQTHQEEQMVTEVPPQIKERGQFTMPRGGTEKNVKYNWEHIDRMLLSMAKTKPGEWYGVASGLNRSRAYNLANRLRSKRAPLEACAWYDIEATTREDKPRADGIRTYSVYARIEPDTEKGN